MKVLAGKPITQEIGTASSTAAGNIAVQLTPPLVSVVIPCLNQVDGIGTCVRKAMAAFECLGVSGEVIVVDNGSTDGSAEVAASDGALVVHERRRGYGSAYLAGFHAARGQYFVMGDGDDTYYFLDIPRFLEPLRNGTADRLIGGPASRQHSPRRYVLVTSVDWQSDTLGHAAIAVSHSRVGCSLRDAILHSRGLAADASERSRHGVRVGDDC